MARIPIGMAKSLGIDVAAGVGVNLKALEGGLTVRLPPEAVEPPRSTAAANRFQVVLPLPPPLSRLFNNVAGRGKVPSKEYVAWRKRASQALASAVAVQEPVEVRIVIRAGAGWRMNSDLANREKSITDELVRCGVISDDKCSVVHRISVEYRPLPEPPKGVPSVAVVVVEHTLVGSVPLGSLPTDPQME